MAVLEWQGVSGGASNGDGGVLALRCAAEEKEESKNGMVAMGGSRRALRLQDGGHRQWVRPATARGLGGQSTDDARPPRGGNFLNPVGTVASELSIQLLGGPTDGRR